MPDPLTPEALALALDMRDLSDPTSGRHAVQLLVDEAATALAASWQCDVRRVQGPRVVPLADNYDRLRYPPEAVTREGRYTRYANDTHVLRSHTSAMIPTALRDVASEGPADLLLVCPGITFRRDSIDRLHTGTPHQLDLWRITRQLMGEEDLDEMLHLLTAALFPHHQWRSEPRVHPYTLNGRQVDVRVDDEWIEVWECGLAHPEVLAGAGLDGYTGLALGMGLDRLLMLRKGIPDIRLLRSTDPRIAEQMLDLTPYRPVSDLPGVRRDISIAIDPDDDAEVLGDRIRDALGDDADLLESVTILSQTSFADLPQVARERLGMTDRQKNVLVRIAIRPFDRTLTDADANLLRDRVYASIHRGTTGQWAAG